MATRHTESAPTAGGAAHDDLESLFGYEVNEADAAAIRQSAGNLNHSTSRGPGGGGAANTSATAANVGLDKEVKVAKRRDPIAKLDEARLLSQAGIPKLKVLARDKLVLSGKKGQEFEDVGRLLEMYQLWMDDLYPRAKMADALAMVEKLGHGKRMQMLRRDWINEGKPKEKNYDDEMGDDNGDGEKDGQVGIDVDEDPFAGLMQSAEGEGMGGILTGGEGGDGVEEDDDDEGLFVPEHPKAKQQAANPPQAAAAAPAPAATEPASTDDLDALLAEGDLVPSRLPQSTGTNQEKPAETDDVPMEDDLDALLAEDGVGNDGVGNEPVKTTKSSTGTRAAQYEDDYADDMDVLRDMW